MYYFYFFYPAFVSKIAKYVNKRGKVFLLLFTKWVKKGTISGKCSCFCFFYPAFVPKIVKYVNKRGEIARALQRAHVFAARKVHWTLRLSGSANLGDFSRYALISKTLFFMRACHCCVVYAETSGVMLQMLPMFL